MQPSDHNHTNTMVSLVENIVSTHDIPHRQHIMAVLLLGSATTGEMCSRSGTSDIDLLLVMEDDIDEDGCFMLKEHLRKHFAVTQPETSLGLRCRYLQEMDNFSRYLALQGFHLPQAKILYVSDQAFDVSSTLYLCDFPNHSATGAEFLCIFGECLWGEIRAKAHQGISGYADHYLEAKVLLSYLNLLLVTDGVFIPTHRERAACWKSLHPGKSYDIIEAAVAIKRGANVTATGQSITKETASLRTLCLEMIGVHRDCQKINPIETDPAIFWLPCNRPDHHSDRINAMRDICRMMYSRISSSSIEAESTASSWCRKHTNSEIATLIKYLSDVPLAALAKQLHVHRIQHSEVSIRDWGHIQHLNPLSECS